MISGWEERVSDEERLKEQSRVSLKMRSMRWTLINAKKIILREDQEDGARLFSMVSNE